MNEKWTRIIAGPTLIVIVMVVFSGTALAGEAHYFRVKLDISKNLNDKNYASVLGKLAVSELGLFTACVGSGVFDRVIAAAEVTPGVSLIPGALRNSHFTDDVTDEYDLFLSFFGFLRFVPEALIDGIDALNGMSISDGNPSVNGKPNTFLDRSTPGMVFQASTWWAKNVTAESCKQFMVGTGHNVKLIIKHFFSRWTKKYGARVIRSEKEKTNTSLDSNQPTNHSNQYLEPMSTLSSSRGVQ